MMAVRLFLLRLRRYHKKFSIGEYRFDFMHSIRTWYIPLSIHFGNDGGDCEYGIGFLKTGN